MLGNSIKIRYFRMTYSRPSIRSRGKKVEAHQIFGKRGMPMAGSTLLIKIKNVTQTAISRHVIKTTANDDKNSYHLPFNGHLQHCMNSK